MFIYSSAANVHCMHALLIDSVSTYSPQYIRKILCK